MPVESLLPADSPRLEGLSEGHALALAGSGTEFEPILVHRDTGRVVDGMHRLRAATLRGEHHITVRYVEGASADLFIRSVQANIGHGLPLTLGDRKAAVLRILATHPHWSDRAIAAVTGVSPKTVGAVRGRCSTEEPPQSNPPIPRVGRDGRARPTDMPERREKARSLLAERPRATLREVAQEAGVSVSTAHRLRQELRSCTAVRESDEQPPAAADVREDSACLPPLVVAAPQRCSVPASRPAPVEPSSRGTVRIRVRAMDVLSNDPSIRFTDSGRALLRWLNGQAHGLAAGEQLLAAVPPHCARALTEVVSHYAREWERLAAGLQSPTR
ncbi:helix-turn-helix domain-containing protein [Streptomyces sp. NBC_00654]|uniref:helix-turn-helix domain-containing protein n=1 Tax=Streptomyces sp. NBC_00654 TaxID=2975799 RepID=UPI00225A3A3C|nr:helix-turn-helix domain-containing protein [Streptomyces sp. NBC_00654]MCX4967297.1 helix-turn-helix domain-containing protein [Streptomyces sp. NBC_00654]